MRTTTLAALVLFLAACGDSGPPAEPPVPRAVRPEMPISPLSETSSRSIEPLPESAPVVAERTALCLRLLESGTTDEVKWASRQLGMIGEAAVAPLSVAMNVNLEKNPALVRNILDVFAEHLPGPGAVDAIAAVAGGPDGSLRLNVARALGNTGAEAAIAPLIALACDPGDFRVSGAAIKGLANTPLDPTFAALAEVFPHALNKATRAEAIAVLARSLPGEAAEKLIRAQLQSPAVDLAILAAVALLDVDGETATAALHRRLEAEVPLSLEFRALEALAKRHDPFALERLLELTANPDAPWARPAVDPLAKFDDRRVDATLGRLALAADKGLAAVALSAYVRRGSPEALDLLDETIRSEDRDRRFIAALALARLPDEEFVERAAAAANAEADHAVRIKFLNALGILADPAGAPAALRAILEETEDTPTRAEVVLNGADALLLMPELPEDVLVELARIAGEGSLAQRTQACRVLGRHGSGPAAGAAILGLLSCEYPDARMVAMAAWVAFADATPEPLLDVAAREPSRLRAAELRTAAERVRCRLLR